MTDLNLSQKFDDDFQDGVEQTLEQDWKGCSFKYRGVQVSKVVSQGKGLYFFYLYNARYLFVAAEERLPLWEPVSPSFSVLNFQAESERQARTSAEAVSGDIKDSPLCYQKCLLCDSSSILDSANIHWTLCYSKTPLEAGGCSARASLRKPAYGRAIFTFQEHHFPSWWETVVPCRI